MCCAADGSDVYADHFSEGGTSLSSPLWTGHVGGAPNAAHVGGPLGRANSTIYPIAERQRLHRVQRRHRSAPTRFRPRPGWDFRPAGVPPNLTEAHEGRGQRARLTPVKNVMPKNKPDPAPILAKGPDYGCSVTVRGRRRATRPASRSPRRSSTSCTPTSRSAATARPLRVGMTVANLSATLPQGWTSMDYMVFWTKPATGVTPPATYTQDYFAADVWLYSSGTPTYTDGNAAYDDTGRLAVLLGEQGHRDVHARAERARSRSTSRSRTWAGRRRARQLGTAGAQTAESNPATGLIVDAASTAKEYVLGAKSCLSTRR